MPTLTRAVDTRMAVASDEERLFHFVWSCHEEMPFGRRSEKRVRELIQAAVHRRAVVAPDLGLMVLPPAFGIVAGPTGIEAGIGMIPQQWWYGPDHALFVFFFFVAERFRGGHDHASALTKFAVKFADDLNMPLIYQTLNAPKGKLGMLSRSLDRVGATFAHGLAA